MIEVSITQSDMLRAADDKRSPYDAPSTWRIGAYVREKLRAAGIPLRHTFDLAAEICPLAGRLEWYEDRFTETKVFRWYPPEEAVTECPL